MRHLLALGIALVLAGCATTAQTRGAEPAGFLKDYSQFRPGEGEEAQLVYRNPRADFSAYSSIQIDPVTIWRSEGREIADVPDEELKELADRLESVLRKELQTDFSLVDRGGPGVLRLRVALTEAKGAPVALGVVSSVVPQVRLISGLKKLGTGTHAFVGRVGIEAELLDGLTNERLAAGVDERAGTRALRGGVSTWSDVDQAFEYWAKRLHERLRELRTGA